MAEAIWAVVRTRFSGMHNWPGAPEGTHDHLLNPHRHEFHVELRATQAHDDRDIEFFQAKDDLDAFLRCYPFNLKHRSCEMLAREITEWAMTRWGDDRNYVCSVFEDGENGALVETSRRR